MIIDAHQHFWRISRGDYFWMDDSVAGIRKDYLPAHLAPLAARCGITGTVAVQAAESLAETEFLLQLAEADPLVKGVVGWIDLTGEVDDQLARIAHPALRGIRPMLQDIEEAAWVLREDVLHGLRKVAAAGLRMDGLIRPRHLRVVAELARRIPELPIVIDHCAKPAFAGTDPGAAWRDGMAALSECPGVYCKLSGLVTEFGPGWTVEALRPVFDHVVSVFGAERLMWGSDWPVLDLAGDYVTWLEACRTMAAALSVTERTSLFGGTAADFYGLDR